jgi:hypothetical protein
VVQREQRLGSVVLAGVQEPEERGRPRLYQNLVKRWADECRDAVATMLGKGEKVRGIVRNPEKAAEWQKQGTELFKADYDDVDSLTAAFTGVAGVFVMLPPNFTPAPDFAETKATLKVLQEALSRALPSKAVYLSSIGAEQASGLGLITSLHLLEETLGDLPFSHAFLRAGWFFENSAGDVASARHEGKIRFQLHPLDRKCWYLQGLTPIGKKVSLPPWSRSLAKQASTQTT